MTAYDTILSTLTMVAAGGGGGRHAGTVLTTGVNSPAGLLAGRRTISTSVSLVLAVPAEG